MTGVGILIGIGILAALLVGPAVAILRSKGPSLPIRLAWAALSLATILLYIPILRLAWSNEVPAWWQNSMWTYQPLIFLVLYALPFSVFVAFRVFVVSKFKD